MQVEVNPEWSQRLKALADRIAAVEVRVKQAEQISGRVVYPAVGELRYLGRNLARILGDLTGGDINPEAFETHLRDAELCCTRANNDVIDAVFSHVSIELDFLRQSYGAPLLNMHLADYVEILTIIRDGQEKIAMSRRRVGDGRDRVYADLGDDFFDKLIEYHSKLQLNTEILEEAYADITKAKKRYSFHAGLNVFFAIAALLLTIGAALL